MKKLCISWLLFSISTSVSAYDTNDTNASKIKWQLNSDGNGIVLASNGIMTAVLRKNFWKEVIFSYDQSKRCEDMRDYSSIGSAVWYINKQPIKMSIYCFDKVKNYRATSKVGNSYIYSQFKTENKVMTSMGSVTTNGFNKIIRFYNDTV